MSGNLGWKGKRVKHADGRTGVIRSESCGFCFVGLTIAIDGIEGTEWVQLNSNGPDTGAFGWCWNASIGEEPENWLPLGDHNSKAA
ncbi:hypothetical protein [Ralstonia pickettii]|uniref:DUF551 domain-containing protein n=1 Tax=Ralstonia pickettii TaxID=329 RepID=A0AAW4Q8V7_RALPI|nr:hypothetical protein [Ralstonia pickettii]MBA9846779.1 hypothetical protein [Ralstonia pickettii]MBA9852069.1 hypothetical protein [Ralstonia pickettii]MBA9919916.1 hypothetical protein [Ralstonia pickettii]MBA9959018.1 hypothetical protein [Ralstonia pickettii]MBA9964603.1 hypothetical protein [Ralstonia pickettii]